MPSSASSDEKELPPTLDLAVRHLCHLSHKKNLISDLLLDGGGDGGHKVEGVQVEVVAEDLGKLLGGEEVLVLVPEERVPQLLALDVHVEPYGNKDLGLELEGLVNEAVLAVGGFI